MIRFLLALILGPIYWAVKGKWGHAIVVILLPILWVIFPFFHRSILKEDQPNVIIVNNNNTGGSNV